MVTVTRFLTDEDGASLVEYVILVALFAAFGILSMRNLGGTASK